MATDRNKPTYQIKVMVIGETKDTDYSFVLDKYLPGIKKPKGIIYSYLIVGKNIPPMIVDTGIKEEQFNFDISDRIKIVGAIQRPEQKIANQLAKFGYTCNDIKVILHTHLHIDHAGNDHLFPNAKIIFTRKEIMFSVAGIMGAQYPPEYISYMVWQINTPGRVRLIDDTLELFPGIILEPTEGHTWGSMNIKVNTEKGLAIICGDVIYNETLQCHQNEVFPDIVKQSEHLAFPFGDHPTGNNWNLWAARAGIQKVMAEADIVLPLHDPLVVEKYGYEIG